MPRFDVPKAIASNRDYKRNTIYGVNAPWFQEVRNELDARDRECQLLGGPLFEYARPDGVDPYKYKSVYQLQRNLPFDRTKDCRPMIKDHSKFKPVLDKTKRYYKNIRHPHTCKAANGLWRQQSFSRDNGYDKGVCWADAEDGYCGTIFQNHLSLRSAYAANQGAQKFMNVAKNDCNNDPNCSWMSIDNSRSDCVSKKRDPKYSKISLDGSTNNKQTVIDRSFKGNPPKDMPQDLTNGGIEEYLYDWYQKNSKDIDPPETNELIGEGDRCNGPGKARKIAPSRQGDNKEAEEEAKRKRLLDEERKRVAYYRSLHQHPPMKNARELQEIMGPEKYGFYSFAWHQNKDNQDALDQLFYEYFPIHDPVADAADMYDEQKKEHLKKNAIKVKVSPDALGATSGPVVKMLPSVPQSIVNMVMKHIASLGNVTSHRGLLAWHSTGSGKTCTATGVMDAFWDNKTRDIIFASSLDAIASNPDYKFHECAKNLFKRFQNFDIKKVANMFEARKVRYLSFAKLSNRVKRFEEWKMVTTSGNKNRNKARMPTKSQMQDMVDLDNSILIIDEVHNLFRPLATQRTQHEYLEQHLLDPTIHPGMKVVILTATPGDNIQDVVKLLNIVRNPSHPKIRVPDINNASEIKEFKQSIRGLISFFDMSNDLTKFPRVIDSDPIRYPMSTTQLNKYIEAYKEAKTKNTDFEKLAKKNQVNKYWAAARRYSNMLYNFDKDMALSDFSSKLPALLDIIKKERTSKHYVYSAFYENRGYGGQGILAIAKELEKMGYEKMTVSEARIINKTGKLPEAKPRYILAIQKEIGEEGSSTAGKNLGELIKVFNNPENKHGEHIQVMLASQGFNEGIDLKAVRHIHIFEPLVTWASDKQTIGRAARYCSHADLNKDADEWMVRIHRYISDIPIDLHRPSTGAMEEKALDLRFDIHNLTQQLERLDSKEHKGLIKEIKTQIKDKEKEIKVLEKDAKKKIKMDANMLQNVEELVYNEARERIKGLLTVYQAMKEAAIDCRVLQEFHSTTGNPVVCESF